MTHTQRMLNGLRSAPVTLCRDNVEDVTFLVRAHFVVLAGMDHVTISAAEYRVAKTHRMAYLHMSFSAKEPYN